MKSSVESYKISFFSYSVQEQNEFSQPPLFLRIVPKPAEQISRNFLIHFQEKVPYTTSSLLSPFLIGFYFHPSLQGDIFSHHGFGLYKILGDYSGFPIHLVPALREMLRLSHVALACALKKTLRNQGKQIVLSGCKRSIFCAGFSWNFFSNYSKLFIVGN